MKITSSHSTAVSSPKFKRGHAYVYSDGDIVLCHSDSDTELYGSWLVSRACDDNVLHPPRQFHTGCQEYRGTVTLDFGE